MTEPDSPPPAPHDDLDFAPAIPPAESVKYVPAAPEPPPVPAAPPPPPSAPPPPASAVPPPTGEAAVPPPPPSAGPPPADSEWQEIADPEDIRKNKGAAMIGYLFFFMPLIMADKSRFARFHANQSLVLWCVGGGLILGCYIIAEVVGFMFGWTNLHYFISLPMYFLCGVTWMLSLCMAGMGAFHAYNGEMKELPVIGAYRILK